MQKLADGHDTDAGSSPPWLWSRCAAVPQAGPALDCATLDCAVLDCPVHPVAAPTSSMDTQPNASRSALTR